jgi:error-prone DNA polymerase
MAAVLSNEGGYYPTRAYISEARRIGLEIKAPDINQSAWFYQGSNRTIRVGFMQIKGIKKSFIDKLIIERNKEGPFSSLPDFLLRTGSELGQGRLLIKAGCFDNIAGGLSRPGMLWQAYAHARGQYPGHLPNPPEYSRDQKLQHEIECFGFVLSGHPIDLYPVNWITDKIVKASEMENYTGRKIKVLGWLITEKITQTRKGDPMEFVTFEDRSAIYEATFFPDVYRSLWHLLTPNCLFLLDGIVEEDFGVPTLNVKGLKRLELAHKSCYGEGSGNIEETEEVRSRFSSAETESESFA